MSDFASFDMGGPDPVDQGNQQQQGGYYPPDQNNGYPPQQQNYGQPPAVQQQMGGMWLPGMDGGFGMAANMMASNQMAGVAQGLLEEKMGAGLKDISVAAGQLKYYFQVDTRYVMKKIGLLLFPFIPGTQWSRNGKDGKFLPPKDDINSPDLYIPVMAFLTYVLVAGVIMGTSAASATAEFSAGELGTLLSNAWGFLLVEVLVCYAGVWLLNLADITIYDIVAYTGYKFIGMVLTLLSYLGTNNDMVFHAVLLWTAAALSFNLVQTIRHASDSPKLLYFAIGLVTAQVFFMWWFTSSVTTPVAVPELAAKLRKGPGMGMGKASRN